jgi:acyl-CoA thioester hydrolase
MYQFETNIRVRYADTDQMGYVYYGNYARFYEIARVEGLRNLGLTYKELESMGVMMPVFENNSKYIAPALYDENLTIKTTIEKKPLVRIKFDYEIRNEQNIIIHTGNTLLVFVDMHSGKPCKMPEIMENILAPYF